MECPVCLEPIKETGSDTVKKLEECKHTFHKECIDQWLRIAQSKACPICRADIEEGVCGQNGEDNPRRVEQEEEEEEEEVLSDNVIDHFQSVLSFLCCITLIQIDQFVLSLWCVLSIDPSLKNECLLSGTIYILVYVSFFLFLVPHATDGRVLLVGSNTMALSIKPMMKWMTTRGRWWPRTARGER